MTIDVDCNRCGSSKWKEVEKLSKSYPDRRKDRDQTTRRVFVCKECGAEGRVYEDGQSGYKRMSNALR